MARTTLVFQCIPSDYTRDMLVQLLRDHGFSGHFDFVYMPCNFATGKNFGYGFINFVSDTKAVECMDRFQGFTGFGIPQEKACFVSAAELHGRKENVERFRNSPVMHPKVPEAFKPAVFGPDGRQMRFPRPTKTPKAPKSSRMREVAGDGGD